MDMVHQTFLKNPVLTGHEWTRYATYRTLKWHQIAICLSWAMRRMTSTLWRVCPEWYLPYAEYTQNDILPYAEYAQNGIYLMLSMRKMKPTLRWVCAELHLQYLTLSMRRMTPTFRWVCEEWHLHYAAYSQNDTYVYLKQNEMEWNLNFTDYAHNNTYLCWVCV